MAQIYPSGHIFGVKISVGVSDVINRQTIFQLKLKFLFLYTQINWENYKT